MNCVYIGDDFYWKSGSAMSCIYEITIDGDYKRSDWAKVEIALSTDKIVNIRPATKEELKNFQEQLKQHYHKRI